MRFMALGTMFAHDLGCRCQSKQNRRNQRWGDGHLARRRTTHDETGATGILPVAGWEL